MQPNPPPVPPGGVNPQAFDHPAARPVPVLPDLSRHPPSIAPHHAQARLLICLLSVIKWPHLWRSNSNARQVDQIDESDVHRIGDSYKHDQRWILLSAFDAPHVGPIDVGSMRKFLLGQAERLAGREDGLTERDACGVEGIRGRLGWHPAIVSI